MKPATTPSFSSERPHPEGRGTALRLAYLTNIYPHVSHTFIRREILEMERRGHEVLRLSIRPSPDVVDPGDRREASRTISCFGGARARLVVAALRLALTRPLPFLRGVRLAFSLAHASHRGLLRHAAYLVEAAYLLRVVRRHGVRHLHVHFGTNPAAVAMLMRRMGGPPWSMTIHGPTDFDAPEPLSLGAKVADTAFTVAISDFCAAQLMRWTDPAHWNRIRVVRCTVGDAFFSAAQPVDPASRTVVCVGRLSAQKGHMVLLDAFARVVREGVDARLVLAGDGELRSLVEERIARDGLQDRVEITGWIDEAEIRRRLLESRGLVMASFAEGLPMVIMEALALGRPVVATTIAGIPELVRPGTSGWLTTAGRADQLADALRELLEAPAARLDAMGRVGREAVRRLHDTATEGERLEALFLRAAPDGTQRPQEREDPAPCAASPDYS
jgi:glycosyltransferase involved in cell wall biosynthesis